MAAQSALDAAATAFNESPPSGAAAALRAMHWNAGMDRFNGPRYLAKLRGDELDAVERQLRAKLDAVASVRAARAAAAAATAPPPLAAAAQRAAAALRDSPVAALLAASGGRPSAALARALTEEADGVWSFELLPPHHAAALADAAREHAAAAAAARGLDGVAAGTPAPPPHVPLTGMGLHELAEALLSNLIQPLAAVLLPDARFLNGSSRLDWQHAYVISYTSAPPASNGDGGGSSSSGGGGSSGGGSSGGGSSGGGEAAWRTGLRAHSDDSELTLNLALGAAASGGELVFRHVRGSPREGRELTRLQLPPGRAVLHVGTMLHEVTPVAAGERHALIVWARSSGYRDTSCPCCVTARRATCELRDTWR